MMQERAETSRTLIRSRQEGVDAAQPEWRSLCSGPRVYRDVPRCYADEYFAPIIYNIVRNGHVFSQM